MSEREDRTDESPALEVECDLCGGRGYRDDFAGTRCTRCDGAGDLTTDFGDAVLEFVLRRLKARLREMLED